MSKKAVIIDSNTKEFYCASNKAVDGNEPGDGDHPFWSEKSEDAHVFDDEEQANQHVLVNNMLEDEARSVEVVPLDDQLEDEE